jgi:hypothetical protein
MILDAQETRYMSDSYYHCKMNYVMKCIKNAAHGGNYDIDITEQIDKETITKLKDLGYTVQAHSPCLYSIGWVNNLTK